MDDRSWWQPPEDPPALQLPADLRARDPLQGRDCGQIAQMRPFVRQFSQRGDTVLDPFCGFASTLVAAVQAGREGLGIEVDPQRAGIARERLHRLGCEATVLTGALPALELPQRVQLCLTNVPYFGCGWRGAALPGQLYAQPSLLQYLDGMRAVFHGVRAHLDEGAHCIVMVENVVLGGRPLPLAQELAGVLGGLFTACEERVLCYSRAIRPLRRGESRSNRSHETALIYRHRRERLDIAAAAALLQALTTAGFTFAVHGSYAAWCLDPDTARHPADLDLHLPHDQSRLDALLGWLDSHGFALSLWGRRVAPAVRLQTLAQYHYLRVERLDADGGLLRVDLSLAPDTRFGA